MIQAVLLEDASDPSKWMDIPEANTIGEYKKLFHDRSGEALVRAPQFDRAGMLAFGVQGPGRRIFLVRTNPANHVPDEEHPVFPGGDLEAFLGRS